MFGAGDELRVRPVQGIAGTVGADGRQPPLRRLQDGHRHRRPRADPRRLRCQRTAPSAAGSVVRQALPHSPLPPFRPAFINMKRSSIQILIFIVLKYSFYFRITRAFVLLLFLSARLQQVSMPSKEKEPRRTTAAAAAATTTTTTTTTKKTIKGKEVEECFFSCVLFLFVSV